MSNKETNEDGKSKETFWESIKSWKFKTIWKFIRYYLFVIIIFISFILIIRDFISYLCSTDTYFNLIIKDSEYISRGEIGDMFGVVNALFSGLAFIGMVITILLQRAEISLQHAEQDRTLKEYMVQNNAIKHQRFESTFFNLLTMFEHIKDNLEYLRIKDNKIIKGRTVLHDLYTEMLNTFDIRKGRFDSNKERDNLMIELKKLPMGVLNIYFNFFDTILNKIDKTELLKVGDNNDDELETRNQYIIILRSSLSHEERGLLFYYFVLCGGWRKEIAEKYGLFYGFNPKNLAKEEHYNFFDSSAYEY